MDLFGIGYSNIRLPSNSSSYIYKYNPYINTFPEEVYIHEFLHSLERILKEREYQIPNLHDNKKYGYTEESLTGLKNWYADYLQCNIKTADGELTGLDEIVYKLTPPAQSDFQYILELEYNKEPKNIIEEIIYLFKSIFNMFGAKVR